MQSNLKQLSLADIYTNIDRNFQQDKPKLIKHLDQYIYLSELISQSFFIFFAVFKPFLRPYNFFLPVNASIAIEL